MLFTKNDTVLETPLDYWSYYSLPMWGFLGQPNDLYVEPIDLNEELTVIEVLKLMFKSERINFPIYSEGEYLWEVFLANLLVFITEDEGKVGLFYHKLNFDLKSVRKALKLRSV